MYAIRSYYGIYLILLIGEFTGLMLGFKKMAFTMGLLGFMAAISAHSNLGAVFGLLDARHYWYGSYLPIYFILSALVSGGALTALIVYFNHKARGKALNPTYTEFMLTMGKLQALFLGVLMFFVVWKIIPRITSYNVCYTKLLRRSLQKAGRDASGLRQEKLIRVVLKKTPGG